jgi:transposase
VGVPTVNLNERMDSLPSAHERAFAHFGGACQTLLYDRMRTVEPWAYLRDVLARINSHPASCIDELLPHR